MLAGLLMVLALAAQPEGPGASSAPNEYPMRALRGGVSGRAVVSCVVRLDFTLEACKVVEEDPAEFGFGEGALKRAGSVRLKPPADGTPVAPGATVRVPFVFTSAAVEGAPAADPPPAPESLSFDQLLQCHTIFTRQVQFLHQDRQKPKLERSRQMLFEAGKARGMTRDRIKGRIRGAFDEAVYDLDNTCDGF